MLTKASCSLYEIPDGILLERLADELVMVAAVDDVEVVELLNVVVAEITVKLPVRLIPILRKLSETSLITCKVYVTTAFGSNPSTMN